MTVYFGGKVQGVGFRYSTQRVATGYDVTGTVRNLDDGRVEMVAEGEEAELQAFLEGIQDSGLGGLIREKSVEWEATKGSFRGFQII